MSGDHVLRKAGTHTARLMRTIRHVGALKWDLGRAWARRGMRVDRLLFHPQRPNRDAVMYQICHLLGYRISGDPRTPAALALAWEDRTFRPVSAELASLAMHMTVLNVGCRDVSKHRVDAVHQEVFGYGAAIDPRTHEGPYVRKANDNARHDGRVIHGPVDRLESGVVYQRVVDNRVGDDLVEDIRVAVYGDAIPLCYLKRRPIENRFSNTNSWVSIATPSEVLSWRERRLIVQFCRRMGMDVGEVDALRDRRTGVLYVVDTNPTPAGPPNGLPQREARVALRRLAAGFAPMLPDLLQANEALSLTQQLIS